MNDSRANGEPTRRRFLGRSPLAAAALGGLAASGAQAAKRALKPSVSAQSAARVIGANDRINIGSIGCGGMGTAHLRDFVRQSDEEKNIQVVAACDIYTVRKERARKTARLEPKDVFHDYRELLARGDVDAVIIASPDHWHGQMALDALTAGKDVYLQKPMTHTIEEARQVAETAKRLGRVLQVGSQGLSSSGTHKARQLIEQGEIGELLWAQGTSARNSILGEWNWRVEPQGTPEAIDWPRWLGPAPRRPFSPERYFRWRKYWDYSGGIATDLFYHTLGPLLYAMGAQFPSAVSASGGIYVQKDREVPDTYATTIEYPGFYINLSGSMANEAANRYHAPAIYGHKGTIMFERGRLVVHPETLTPGSFDRKGEAPAPKVYEFARTTGGGHYAHTSNFFECVRTRKTPNLDARLGYQIMVAIRLGVDAYRQSRTKLFEPQTEKVVERPSARPGWEGDGQNHEAEERTEPRP